MKDSFRREINYARISVTDRCNLRCVYCMGADGVEKKSHHEILRYEQLLDIARALIACGIKKIRLTGGEPLVRKGICDFVSALATLKGVEEVGLTTNGILLPKYATELKTAGLKGVNISIDSLKPDRYAAVTVAGSLKDALAGVAAAKHVGFNNIKINAVLQKAFNDDEVHDFARFAAENGLKARFIELMPFAKPANSATSFISSQEIVLRDSLTKIGDCGSTDAMYYRYADGTVIGFISAVSNKFCAACSRIRVTADGKLLPCLHGNMEFDLKDVLFSQEALKSRIEEAILAKPKCHFLDCGTLQKREMSKIGG